MFDFFFDPVESFKNMINDYLSDLATTFVNSAMDFIAEYVINETDMSLIPQLDLLIKTSKYIAAALALLFFYMKMLNYQRDLASGEIDDAPTPIVVDFVVSILWITMIDKVVLNFFIPLNNMLLRLIASIGIDVEMWSASFLRLSQNLQLAALQMIIMMLVLGIALIIFAIQGAIRYIDIAIALIIAPIIGATRTSQKEAMGLFLKDITALVFIQVLHLLLCYFILQFIGTANLMSVLLTIAVTVVAMRGPQAIRQYIYSSGTAGMASGAGRLAMMRMLLKK